MWVCGCEGVRVRVYTAHHQQTHYNIKQVDLHSLLKRIFLLSNYVQRMYVRNSNNFEILNA